MDERKTILAKARAWAAKNKLFGAQAFFRYVILSFIENLNQISDDFVFKGGNLLWVYIGTPRSTIDLDFATLKINSHDKVKEALEAACKLKGEIRFSLISFKEIEQEVKSGCVATISYATDQGASNRFSIDVVYALDTDHHVIKSPIHEIQKIRSATIENIIADKLAACHRYGSGNTRMKDFDDLWRLSQSGVEVRSGKLNELLKARKISPELNEAWIADDIERAWDMHSSRYKDLPKDLRKIFRMVNEWLRKN